MSKYMAVFRLNNSEKPEMHTWNQKHIRQPAMCSIAYTPENIDKGSLLKTVWFFINSMWILWLNPLKYDNCIALNVSAEHSSVVSIYAVSARCYFEKKLYNLSDCLDMFHSLC